MAAAKVKRFTEFVEALDQGVIVNTLSKELRDLNAAIDVVAQDSGKAKGELAIKFKIEVNRNGTMTVHTETSCKVPKPRKEPTSLWLLPDGNFSDENPKQVKMFPNAESVGTKPLVIDESKS